jgi:hypothetical protein
MKNQAVALPFDKLRANGLNLRFPYNYFQTQALL